MSFTQKKREQIKRYLLEKINRGDTDFVHATVEAYSISMNSVYRYLKQMEKDGTIRKTNGKYVLTDHKSTDVLKRSEKGFPSEDSIYDQFIHPLMKDLPDNVQRIWQYGFMEMINNAIDHSEAENILVSSVQNTVRTTITIQDDGVGIFKKIMDGMGYASPDDAVLELFKGKLTTDTAHHSGEGIFFTSRIMDQFYACSDGKKYSYDYRDGSENIAGPEKGTFIYMELSNSSGKKLSDVFDQYADADGRFTKTRIPIKNMFGMDPVSRSQARRLCQRLDKFEEVELDFKGIDEIGQGFAHELFVVFQKEHQKINLIPVNISEGVKRMIYHVKGG